MQHLSSSDKKALSSDTDEKTNVAQTKNDPAPKETSKQSSIQLSLQSQKIQQLNQELQGSDGIDKAKVADVKERLAAIKLDIQQTGPKLESASERIADKIVEMDILLSKY
tara:strand:- start:70724 stop:71053 length:330 start_codon:yes stop_codon:yes gene_type:complete